eukprot:COSAG02_NODE_1164_length_14157_cov_2.925096_7_plen_99_part_00
MNPTIRRALDAAPSYGRQQLRLRLAGPLPPPQLPAPAPGGPVPGARARSLACAVGEAPVMSEVARPGRRGARAVRAQAPRRPPDRLRLRKVFQPKIRI